MFDIIAGAVMKAVAIKNVIDSAKTTKDIYDSTFGTITKDKDEEDKK